MNPKRIIIVGTMAFTITVSTALWSEKAGASQPICTSIPTTDESDQKEDILEVLGMTSNEQLRDALYNGKSLAELAAERGRDVEKVIGLQVAEMTEQLDARLAGGSLTYADYQAQKSELAHILTNSAYGRRC